VKGPQLAIAALIVLALVAAFFSRQPGSDSPLPSAGNQGPRGAAVLATWLRESGHEIIEHEAPLTELPAGVRTLVLAAPSLSELTRDEVQQLERFVRGGGTLVYLVSRTRTQPALNEWLAITPGEVLELGSEPGVEDVGGATVRVRVAGGALSGLESFRVSAERTVEVGKPGAVPVASGGSLWWLPLGEGEIWVGAGPDLLENARLELLDNARFWGALAARGPMAFDEYHLAAHGAGLPVSIAASLVQLLFLAGLYLWARAPRMGPIREERGTVHRSSLEYVQAMAALTRNAGVEGELVAAIKSEFRRRLEEEHGLSRQLDWASVGRELERRGVATASEVTSAGNEGSFLAASRQLARLERALT